MIAAGSCSSPRELHHSFFLLRNEVSRLTAYSVEQGPSLIRLFREAEPDVLTGRSIEL
jgi:hypothetical protein